MFELTIAICVYNQSKIISELINNIKNVASENIQVIISDDCSDDNTYEILRQSNFSEHVVLKRNKLNLGPTKNLQSTIDFIRGQYVIFLGGDDFINPLEIKRLIPYLKKNYYSMLVCLGVRTSREKIVDFLKSKNENALANINTNIFNQEFNGISEFFYYIATMPAAIWMQATIFRASLVKKVGFSEFDGVDDWGLFHNIALEAQIQELSVKFLDIKISFVSYDQNSRGQDHLKQITRQVIAVDRYWDNIFKKDAMMNVIIKKILVNKESNKTYEDLKITIQQITKNLYQ
jgi:glycosyltransferase involved in cell wall biosynthesis